MNKIFTWLLCCLFITTSGLFSQSYNDCQQHEQVLDEQASIVIDQDGLPEIPEISDIFFNEDEALLQQLNAVQEQRKDLTFFETLQITAAYLKACSWRDIRELIIDHLHENKKRYLVSASTITVLVAAVLLAKRLQGGTKSKKIK